MKKIPNTISTGGGGEAFENQAQATFATLMLMDGRVPGFPNHKRKRPVSPMSSSRRA